MHIKSLLLGSAAALAVVSGAQAADAVVAADPEPMEYVRVCDAYGTGFFYIPGTETCLKIGGQFRYEKRWAKGKTGASSYSNWARGRIEVTAKNDSEYGTVSSWIRMQGSRTDNRGGLTGTYETFDPIAQSITVNSIYAGTNVGFNYTFGIGGLEFGDYDSQFAQFGGYGGRTDWGGTYINWDFGTRQYISYTANMDSFSAIVSIEHDRNANTGLPGDGNDSKYMPDVVAGVKGSFGDWAVTGLGAYDESDESFGSLAKLTGDIGMFGVTLEAFYSNSNANSYVTGRGFSVLAGASAKVTDSISLAADVQYWDQNDNWRVIGDASWAVASGFSVLLEGSIDKAETKTAMLRFQRSF